MMKRLVLLVGVTDVDESFIVGAWEEGILDVLSGVEVDNEMRKMKEKWYPDGIVWREIIVEIPDDQILAAFNNPVIQGSVVS